MSKFQTILGIETSCDETAAAILENKNGRIQILSNIISSSASLQAEFGGVFPEHAARVQLKIIIPVIQESLEKAGKSPKDLDAIAVTFGPGLIGSLLVGVETAKVLATVWNKPLIPINHLMGHFYANWIDNDEVSWVPRVPQVPRAHLPHDTRGTHDTPQFPCLGLLVSGGHTDLVLFEDHGKYQYLGGTRDDAAGECFDKCARLLGYPYPGGPKISHIAQEGNPKAFKLPIPMADSKDYDFSFSGLKTAFANLVQSSELGVQSEKSPNSSLPTPHFLADLCASLQQAIIDSLINKVVLAIDTHNIDQIIVAGGVAANQQLVRQLREQFKGQVLVPPAHLCTDNAAMIASAAFFVGKKINPLGLQANPNLAL